MKIGQLDLSAWTFRGTPLVPLATIARRAVAAPLLVAGLALAGAAVYLGWGREQVEDLWERVR